MQPASKFVKEAIDEAGQSLLGWRGSYPSTLMPLTLVLRHAVAMPYMAQCFIGSEHNDSEDALETSSLRPSASWPTHRIKAEPAIGQPKNCFYVGKFCRRKSSSTKACSRRISYFPFFPDLQDTDFESHLAMVHSRFFPPTRFPSWDRAQPKPLHEPQWRN